MMNDKFLKLLEKKRGESKSMRPLEKDAKMRAVHQMRKMASDEMVEPLKGLKKVTVASDSSEGLKTGLDKAEDLIESKMSEMPDEEEVMDSAKEEMGEEELQSPEEIDAKIKELEALKAQMLAEKA